MQHAINAGLSGQVTKRGGRSRAVKLLGWLTHQHVQISEMRLKRNLADGNRSPDDVDEFVPGLELGLIVQVRLASMFSFIVAFK